MVCTHTRHDDRGVTKQSKVNWIIWKFFGSGGSAVQKAKSGMWHFCIHSDFRRAAAQVFRGSGFARIYLHFCSCSSQKLVIRRVEQEQTTDFNTNMTQLFMTHWKTSFGNIKITLGRYREMWGCHLKGSLQRGVRLPFERTAKEPKAKNNKKTHSWTRRSPRVDFWVTAPEFSTDPSTHNYTRTANNQTKMRRLWSPRVSTERWQCVITHTELCVFRQCSIGT